MGDLLAWGAALSLYPFVVLCTALTGPHSAAERRANAEDRDHLISQGAEHDR